MQHGQAQLGFYISCLRNLQFLYDYVHQLAADRATQPVNCGMHEKQSPEWASSTHLTGLRPRDDQVTLRICLEALQASRRRRRCQCGSRLAAAQSAVPQHHLQGNGVKICGVQRRTGGEGSVFIISYNS